MRLLCAWVLGVSVMTLCVSGQTPAKKPGEAVTLGSVAFKGDLKPGADFTAVVQFAVDKGFHVQANPASEETYVAAALKLDPAVGVVAMPAKYPAGKEETIVGLDKPLKVYEGTFEVLVPLKLASNATLPITINGVLTYQACKGATCFPPRKLKVELKLK